MNRDGDRVITTDADEAATDEIAVEGADGRHPDRDCSPAREDVPCWPYCREGFETPADAEKVDD